MHKNTKAISKDIEVTKLLWIMKIKGDKMRKIYKTPFLIEKIN